MADILKIDIQKLPIIIELQIQERPYVKRYVLKSNKDKSGVFLNKVEQY